jgi:plasmid stabilization system protein ParE
MSLPIFYTPRSKEPLRLVYNLISNRFGVNSADKFALNAEKTIALIAEHPLMFKASTIDENVGIALISKQCSLFYRVTASSVHLLFFWDNRQQPFFMP